MVVTDTPRRCCKCDRRLLLFPTFEQIIQDRPLGIDRMGSNRLALRRRRGTALTGGASFYTGAPGAVVIYMLIAALLLIPQKVTADWYPKIAGWIFMLGALLQLQPSLWSTDGAQGNFMVSMMDPLHIVSILPNALYNAAGLNPVASNILLVLVLFVMGLRWRSSPTRSTVSSRSSFFSLHGGSGRISGSYLRSLSVRRPIRIRHHCSHFFWFLYFFITNSILVF